MSRGSKIERVAELNTFQNVFQSPDIIKGKWNELYFNNESPIIIEVGCGRGEYTVNLAKRFPDKNFIGLDIKGPRLWRGAKTFIEEGMTNGAFIRTLIETITDYFSEAEVSEIWVTFPDPQPKPSREQKRLVSGRFLDLYKQILKPAGKIHLKTDNDDLFRWAIESFEQNPAVQLLSATEDLYHSDLEDELTSIKTTYECKYIADGKTIKYSCISFSQ
jgi:tRNA (guanine-N7-)-methyltransferase